MGTLCLIFFAYGQEDEQEKKFVTPETETLSPSTASVAVKRPFQKEESWDIRGRYFKEFENHAMVKVEAGNYGAPNTLEFSGLYNFCKKKKDVQIAPGCGVMIGEYIGLSPQLFIQVERKKFSVLSNTKYILEVTGSKPEILYSFLEVGYSPGKSRIEFGIISEFWMLAYPKKNDITFERAGFEWEIGPYFKYKFPKGFSLAAEWTVKALSEKEYASLSESSAMGLTLGLNFTECATHK